MKPHITVVNGVSIYGRFIDVHLLIATFTSLKCKITKHKNKKFFYDTREQKWAKINYVKLDKIII